MNSTDPSVSVIVLTFNAVEFVERCLVALRRQSHTDFETVVVDNASTDGTAGFIREHFPDVHLVLSPTNGGYGAGNNLGASLARGGILVFLNPDTIPEPNWLHNLIEGMRRNGKQFATSKITLLSDPQRLNSGGNLIHYLGLSFCRGLNAYGSTYDKEELVSGASGAACAISRKLFERIGGFDPSFFLYHDDVDLSARALLAGEPCLYVPDAVVSHDYTLAVQPRKWGWIEAHRYAVLLKIFRLRTLVALMPALVAVDLITLGYLGSRGRAFVRAKLDSYVWLFRHATVIRRERARAQSVRARTDRQILSVLTDQIPYEQLAPSALAVLGHWLVDPWFRLYRHVCLLVIRW